MSDLKDKKCVPCEGGIEPFNKNEVSEFMRDISAEWKTVNNKKIRRKFPFDNFKTGMQFVQKIADIAEKEQHHPDVCLHYSNVEVELSTHAIGGLSENDFIIAAKIDDLY